MKLENQVTSLELSKKLKSLNFEQESLFYWITDSHPYGSTFVEDIGTASLSQSKEGDNYYSAYTVAELGEIGKRGKIGITAYSEMTKHWWVTGGEWIVEKQKYSHLEEGEKWADVLAKMLIYLKEQELI